MDLTRDTGTRKTFHYTLFGAEPDKGRNIMIQNRSVQSARCCPTGLADINAFGFRSDILNRVVRIRGI